MEEIRIQTHIQEEINALMILASSYITEDVKIHSIEKGLFKQLLFIGLTLLSFIIKERIKRLAGVGVPRSGDNLIKSKGMESRKYLSLFGLLDVKRPSYWDKDFGKIHPADELLGLPRSSQWSYNIQELVGESSSENDFKESVRLMNQLLDLGLSGKSAARNASHLGPIVESFYESKAIEPQPDAVHFSAYFDGKGVPKIKSKSGCETDENPKRRLGKGEKKGIMEMATVSVTASFTPKKRSIERIIIGLMGNVSDKVKLDKGVSKSDKEQDSTWFKGIHRRAFLGDQQKAINYGLDRIKPHMVNPASRFVVPIDAGIGLEEKILAWVEKNNMEKQFDGIILDIIHVSEYVWDAATAVFGEKSKCRQPWVKEVLTDLLNNKVTKVISDLERIKTKTMMSKSQQEQIEKTITYFTNHQHKMNYKTFIEKGYPISSALVESTCGYLVKERMEQSGMRWSSIGAQNILDLRAVKINGDMEEFMVFRIQNDQKTKIALAA